MSDPVDRSRLTALAEKMREAASDLHGMCSDAGYRECVTILRDGTPALLAELAEKDAEVDGARATIEHMTAAMEWLSGHDRQGLDHLEESMAASAERDAAEVRASAAEQERADALASLELHRAETARLSAELADPLGDLVCGSCEGPTRNVELYCDACRMGDLEEDCDRLRVRASTAEAAIREVLPWLDAEAQGRKEPSRSAARQCHTLLAAALVVGDET